MESLIPLEVTQKDDFWRPQYRMPLFSMELGMLYFDEVLGIRTQEITETIEAFDLHALELSGFIVGDRKINRRDNITRRTWVRLYPAMEIAQAVARAYKKQPEKDWGTLFGYMIDSDDLLKYFPELYKQFERVGVLRV